MWEFFETVDKYYESIAPCEKPSILLKNESYQEIGKF